MLTLTQWDDWSVHFINCPESKKVLVFVFLSSFHTIAKRFSQIFNLMTENSTTAIKYSNYKIPKWERVLPQTVFTSSELALFQNVFVENYEKPFYFSDYDLKKLPLRYGGSASERRFSFDFFSDKFYTPQVSRV